VRNCITQHHLLAAPTPEQMQISQCECFRRGSRCFGALLLRAEEEGRNEKSGVLEGKGYVLPYPLLGTPVERAIQEIVPFPKGYLLDSPWGKGFQGGSCF
jgi:hypothetical protein